MSNLQIRVFVFMTEKKTEFSYWPSTIHILVVFTSLWESPCFSVKDDTLMLSDINVIFDGLIESVMWNQVSQAGDGGKWRHLFPADPRDKKTLSSLS